MNEEDDRVPSPFPGMDPYLEDPVLWPNVHTSLITTIRTMLYQVVPQHYFVGIEENVYIVDPLDEVRERIRPDVHVREQGTPTVGEAQQAQASGRSASASPTLVRAPELSSSQLRIPYLTIQDSRDQSIVAILEILSPANKDRGSAAYREFYAKREKILYSDTHWVEIDLLRRGFRALEWARSYDYYAALHRGDSDDPLLLSAWGINIRERLPQIHVPLRAPIADALLDLQEALDTVYDQAHYERRIDYSKDPPSGFDADHVEWIRGRISTYRARLGT